MAILKKLKFIDSGKAAQDAQDAVFRKMSVRKKIRMVSDFYQFAMELNKLGRINESRRV